MPYSRQWDVAPDGRHFVLIKGSERFTRDGSGILAGNDIRIVTHWDRELRAMLRAAEH